MAVPSKAALYKPILEIAVEADELWSKAQFVEAIGERLSLTTEDMAERIPSGARRILDRTDWALYDLMKAGLMDRPIPGRFRINSAGRDYFKEHTDSITNAELSRLARLLESPDPSTATNSLASPIIDDDTSPQDRIRGAHDELRKRLADELLDNISMMSPSHFEQLVLDLLKKMGYGEPERVGGPGDGGIDGIINQDALGLEKVYIQAKRWKGQVGDLEIRNFSGSLDVQGASKGVFVTTSRFAAKARDAAKQSKLTIRLIDGPELANLMISYEVGVITQYTYKIQKLDGNYFSEES